MKPVFGYIRVSTTKQGEQGVSLEAQRDAIEIYARRNSLEIAAWFEEIETAAKRGRPILGRMMTLLRLRRAEGVVIHKIDRGARNLRDWADLAELIDRGVEVHFANEGLDMHSRGGRLSADIQAVVAADYIRNLREETRKGFYGRLKQGLYPLQAPVGYVDTGSGQVKAVDPTRGPLVRIAFRLYATGQYPLWALTDEMAIRGLKSKRGRPLTMATMARTLKNPFYTGVMRVTGTGEVFPGRHEPLVTQGLFDDVQNILLGRTADRPKHHDFTFTRMIKCRTCGRVLIGERQKGHIYYRCHSRSCKGTSLRQESVDAAITAVLDDLTLSDAELKFIGQLVDESRHGAREEFAKLRKQLELNRDQLEGRLDQLTDAMLDGLISKEVFAGRREALLHDQRKIRDQLILEPPEGDAIARDVRLMLEPLKGPSMAYKLGDVGEKRALLKTISSNLAARGKTIDLTLSTPFDLLKIRPENPCWGLQRETSRTSERLAEFVKLLWSHCLEHLSNEGESWQRRRARKSTTTFGKMREAS